MAAGCYLRFGVAGFAAVVCERQASHLVISSLVLQLEGRISFFSQIMAVVHWIALVYLQAFSVPLVLEVQVLVQLENKGTSKPR